ncbi:NmrA family NAD(P)-binding protein [Microbacterium gorillae]|uniref:NmrA family NAD(P)-binding protein n=1 Tax=Microbacterium gorillae TaxID=1231063 RepID=UPI00058C6603|nr:NAD(P)H-binding protein [Microbacterium gorillae]
MFVIAGATGRVGSAVARRLLQEGAEVRVLVRRPEDAAPWQERGAEVRQANLSDHDQLRAAVRGSAGFFVLLPFDLRSSDLDAHARSVTAAVAGAVSDEAIPAVAMLSSGGADRASGTGPIRGLHEVETALRATGTRLTALRPGHFQEKVTDVITYARASGRYPIFSRFPDRPRPMVATADIGDAAAQALLTPASRSEAVDVHGPEVSELDLAADLGTALGCELMPEVIPEPAWAEVLTATGLSAHAAESVAELYRADDAGLLAPRGDRVIQAQTPALHTIRRLVADLTS